MSKYIHIYTYIYMYTHLEMLVHNGYESVGVNRWHAAATRVADAKRCGALCRCRAMRAALSRSGTSTTTMKWITCRSCNTLCGSWG